MKKTSFPPFSNLSTHIHAHISVGIACAGGGRGMRVVSGPGDMLSAFDTCAREATASFGSGDLFVEQLVLHPRHVEVGVGGG